MYIHAKIQLEIWSGLVAVYFGKIFPKTCDALYKRVTFPINIPLKGHAGGRLGPLPRHRGQGLAGGGRHRDHLGGRTRVLEEEQV